MTTSDNRYKPTACILCECNCGLEVELGGEDGRRLVRLRGDRAHPASQGYACEKPHRLDYYQNSSDRLMSPLRRTPEGSYEAIDWPTAISEISARLAKVRDEHGGASIFYYGGGGQGNHLPGAYATATRRVLGSRYRSSALAQEKTGEFWVGERMLGAYTRGDLEHCEVAFFIGKNPWYSHSIPRARVTLKEIAKDPKRTMIVVDPRRTKTAEMADIHLQVRPGTDAWLMSALVAIIVQEGLLNQTFLDEHAVGLDEVRAAFAGVCVAEYCAHAGVAEDQVRQVAGLLAKAQSVASMEDLGVQMNRHSTLVSYLHRLVWLLTGHFGRPGTQYIPTPLLAVADGKHKRNSPVLGARIIGGMVPCNAIADEILTDHEDRYRAMIVEASNPAHSLADTAKMTEALSALDTLVVVDVAMTETARLADYVLPAATQYEKAEATFFNFEFPDNYFHLRAPLMDAPEGPLPEAEIHARLTEALFDFDMELMAELRAAADEGLDAYAAVFTAKVAFDRTLAPLSAVILYRTLGPTLGAGLAQAAVVWGLTLQAAMQHPEPIARAGFGGSPMEAANALFRAILDRPSGTVFAKGEWSDVLGRIATKDGKVHLALSDLLAVLPELEAGPGSAAQDFPLVLSAGERRGFTANTIVRDPSWRKQDAQGALRISPSDAQRFAVAHGGQAKVSTARGSAVVTVEVSETMRSGHISLPNGMGLESGDGVAPNTLTSLQDQDPFVGTPWHKYVPARVEAVPSA